jgi:hypothetical protein
MQAEEAGLNSAYYQEDIRTAKYGDGYGLVMSIFGEFNVFRPEEAKAILAKAFRALNPNGFLLLEPHSLEKVMEIGKQPSSWYSTEKGLFSDEPHLCLQENFWDTDEKVAIERYFVMEAVTGDAVCHSSSMQAYTNEEYRSLLAECGFGDIRFYPSLGGAGDDPQGDLIAILSQKNVT